MSDFEAPDNCINQLRIPERSDMLPRERRDTLESQASSLESEFTNDSEESTYANYRDLLETSDEEDQDSSSGLHVLRRSTTFERILADAIIHQEPIDELEILLEAGARFIDPTVRRPNPLLYSVWQRYPEAAEILIEHGYDVNVIDEYGYSALHLASRYGYTEMIELLLKHGSNVNFNEKTLLDKFPVEAKDEPLRLAIKYGHKDAVEILLKHGADPNGRYFFGSEINLVNPIRSDILEILLEFGADVNSQDRNGLTPIMKASRLRQGMESLLVLMSFGGNINIRADARHDYRTALHYAVLSGSTDIVEVLLENGAQFRFEPEYDLPTPLHLAVRRGDKKIINLLLDAGADINSSTSVVGSVLHMACSEKVHNRLEVMELLLSKGANPNIVVAGLDGSPILPPLGDYLSAAPEEYDTNIINLLLKYGAEVIMKSPRSSPLGLLGCVSKLREHPSVLEEVLEGAQEFDLDLIRKTSLLGSVERKTCLEIAESPLPLRHLSRVCIRHEPSTHRPEAIMKMDVPNLISKYLLYEIS